MIKTVVVCDVCGRMLDSTIEDGFYVNWENARSEDYDARKFFKHMCPKCQESLDAFLDYRQEQNEKRAKLMAERSVVNEQRRNELNSKG